MDLFDHVVEDVAVPDTGSLQEDLRLLLQGVLALYDSPGNRNLLARMIEAVAEHPGGAEVMRDFFAARTRQVAVLVERAAARGEVPRGTRAAEVVESLCAPVYYRLLVTHQPLGPGAADRLAAITSRAARAGAFT
nr:TetR-like C-terminal domain-containing protein [Streptomyces albus]